MKKNEINLVCQDCGTKNNWSQFEVSTWYPGKCDVCNKTKSVTEYRDFYHGKKLWQNSTEKKERDRMKRSIIGQKKVKDKFKVEIIRWAAFDYVICFSIGVQSFEIAPVLSSKQEAKVFAEQLRIALRTLQNET